MFKARLNAAQRHCFARYAGAARWYWNMSLAIRTKAYQQGGVSLSGGDISRRLTRWQRQRRRVAVLHEKVRRQRQDFLHKLTSTIVRENQVIAVEDLHVAGMVKNRHLAKALAGAALGEFRRQLDYKCQWYERDLLEVGRFERTTGVCPHCTTTTSERVPLHVRSWTCAGCGAGHDRDVAAAQVIVMKATGGWPDAVAASAATIARGGEMNPCEDSGVVPASRPPSKREEALSEA